MNKAALSYKPLGGSNKRSLIKRAANFAADRTETYTFKSRNGFGRIDSLLSTEMETLADERMSEMLSPDKVHGRWTDRIYSLVSAPVSSEDFFLNVSYNDSKLSMGGSRFYHDELSTYVEDEDTQMPILPDTSRFAYSDEAQQASKILAGRLAKNLARKHFAASLLQRNYRTMISLRNFRREVVAAHTASRKIQFFWKKRIERTRRRRKRKDMFINCAIKMQCFARCALARRKIAHKRSKILNYNARVITRFVRFSTKEICRKRGRFTRRRIHATRIQARWRGVCGRQFVLSLFRAKGTIVKCWRNYRILRKGPKAMVIARALRRKQLSKKVVVIQKVMRGFMGKRRAQKMKLLYWSQQRSMLSDEQSAMMTTFTREFRKQTYTWLDNGGLVNASNEVQDSTVLDSMRLLDYSSSCILFGDPSNRSKKHMRLFEMDPYINIEELPYRKKVVLAILSTFSNHPAAHLDFAAIDCVRQHLTITRDSKVLKKHLPAHVISNMQNHVATTKSGSKSSNSSKSGKSKSTEEVMDDYVWNHLSVSSMVPIANVLPLLEPSLALRSRISIMGHLPDKMLAEAVILRKWTHYVDKLMKETIWRRRLRNPPRLSCQECLECFAMEKQAIAHTPCPRNRWCGDWVRRDTFRVPLEALKNRLRQLDTFPTLVRNSSVDKVEVMQMIETRSAEAFFSNKWSVQESSAFASIEERDAALEQAEKMRQEEEEHMENMKKEMEMEAMNAKRAQELHVAGMLKLEAHLHMSAELAHELQLPEGSIVDDGQVNNISRREEENGELGQTKGSSESPLVVLGSSPKRKISLGTLITDMENEILKAEVISQLSNTPRSIILEQDSPTTLMSATDVMLAKKNAMRRAFEGKIAKLPPSIVRNNMYRPQLGDDVTAGGDADTVRSKLTMNSKDSKDSKNSAEKKATRQAPPRYPPPPREDIGYVPFVEEFFYTAAEQTSTFVVENSMAMDPNDNKSVKSKGSKESSFASAISASMAKAKTQSGKEIITNFVFKQAVQRETEVELDVSKKKRKKRE